MLETLYSQKFRQSFNDAPCNAFPIAPSEESDQLPIEDKVLA